MAEPLDSDSLHAALRARLGYFRDLGIFDLYRREPGVTASLQASVEATSVPDLTPQFAELAAPGSVSDTVAGREPVLEAHREPDLQIRLQTKVQPRLEAELELDIQPELEEDAAIAPRKPPLKPVAFTPGPFIAPAARAQVLEALRQEIGDCTRCPLGFAGRHTIVFGDGDPNARLLFVGEGPGADEDMQGLPFVGRAGQLLNNMITAMGLRREQVYIANIVKCRPPKNRVPEPVEAITCSQFLLRQIDIVRPEVIVALGSTAATYLLGGKSPLSALRGRLHAAHGAKLIVTYHPAYLLRDPTQKKAAWTDLQLAMKQLPPSR